MTDTNWGHGGSLGPPWSVDLLADLHAEAVEPTLAADLWPKVRADPEAQAIIDAFEATQADLRGLADAPPAPMPADFAARLDAALDTETRSVATVPRPRQDSHSLAPGNVVDLAAARRRRGRLVGWGVGVLAAAAAAVAVVVATLPGGTSTPGLAQPAPTGPGSPPAGALPPLQLQSSELGKQHVEAVQGTKDYGPFADEQKRRACFQANGISPTANPLGGRQVTVDGKPGVLFVLVSGAGRFRLLAVGAACGPGNPDTLADKTVN